MPAQVHKNQLLKLNEEERNNPLMVIDGFFGDYHLQEVREEIQQLQQVALFTDNDTYNNARERSNLVFFCEKLEILAEAAYLLKEKENLFQQYVQQQSILQSQAEKD